MCCLLVGDPAIYPHVMELTRYIKNQGYSVGILSNTFDFADAQFGNWRESVKTFDYISATFHADNAAEHDKFCKADAFNLLVSHMIQSSKLGVSTGLTFNIRPGTESMIYSTVNNLTNDGIKLDNICVQSISETGAAIGNPEFDRKRIDIEQAFGQLAKIESDFPNISIVPCDSFPLCAVPKEYHHLTTKCQFGYTDGNVDMFGNLRRCGCETGIPLGNIFEQGIQEIWNTSPELLYWRAKKYLGSECKDCADLEKCGGGCSLTRANCISPDILCQKSR